MSSQRSYMAMEPIGGKISTLKLVTPGISGVCTVSELESELDHDVATLLTSSTFLMNIGVSLTRHRVAMKIWDLSIASLTAKFNALVGLYNQQDFEWSSKIEAILSALLFKLYMGIRDHRDVIEMLECQDDIASFDRLVKKK